MAGDVLLDDTNVLIRSVQPLDPAYISITTALNQLARSRAVLYYTSQNLGEFWNALTRPISRNGFGLTPEEANRKAKQVEAQLELLADSAHVHREWRQMLVDYSISGVQVHDARLVAAMRVHGVKRILTFNAKDFRRFLDIEAVLPQDVAAARD